MAVLLKDTDLQRLLGTIIINGDTSSVRPNSYVVRLGAEGEFINTGKEFELGKGMKKGIRVPPGHSVGVTAFETIDFRRETVQKLYPSHDLHGLISPTTDLSREGIVAPTTQVDAGYHGTLNWTLTNTSSEERRFVYKERIFRLTIFKLAEGETPDQLYEGDYQDQMGYVRSRRQGPPVGMKDTEWVDAHVEGGPEDLLEHLIESGYPWHLLGKRLKAIDGQFRSVSEEYAEIHDAMSQLGRDVDQLRRAYDQMPTTIRLVLREETGSLQNRWLIGAGSLLAASLGIVLAVTSNESALRALREYGGLIGLGLLLGGGSVLYLVSHYTDE